MEFVTCPCCEATNPELLPTDLRYELCVWCFKHCGNPTDGCCKFNNAQIERVNIIPSEREYTFPELGNLYSGLWHEAPFPPNKKPRIQNL